MKSICKFYSDYGNGCLHDDFRGHTECEGNRHKCNRGEGKCPFCNGTNLKYNDDNSFECIDCNEDLAKIVNKYIGGK